MALTSMSGKKAKMGDLMKQKWPCILTCNLDTNQVKNVIFCQKGFLRCSSNQFLVKNLVVT